MKHYIHTGLFALAILVAVASCSKDDPFEAGTGLTKITAPEVTCTASTYRSLSFSWTPVDGAVQYSYSLKDAAGNLYGGNVTYGTKAFFDGLSSDYPYVFSVIAYPGLDSGKEASSEASLTQKTGLVNNEGTFTSYLASGTSTVLVFIPLRACRHSRVTVTAVHSRLPTNTTSATNNNFATN